MEDDKERKARRTLVCDPIDFSDLGLIMGLTFSSHGLRKITVERDGELRVMNRPYLHCYIQAPKGSFKSTHGRALAELHPREVVVQDNVTHAGLVGSISDNGDFIPPEVCRWGGKVVIMDEVVKDRQGEFTRALLKLMEENSYTRKIARHIKKENKNYGKAFGGAWYKVDEGLMQVYSPFTLIMLSMIPLSVTASSAIGGAQLDRMFTVTYSVSPEQQDEMMRGIFKITIPEWHPSEEVTIKLDDFHKIMDYLNAYLPVSNSTGFKSRPRILDNMLRAFAIMGKHDEHVYELMTRLGSARWEESGSRESLPPPVPPPRPRAEEVPKQNKPPVNPEEPPLEDFNAKEDGE